MYDAVRVFAKAMDDLVRVERFRQEPMDCQRGAWKDGQRVQNYLLGVTMFLIKTCSGGKIPMELFLQIDYKDGLTGDIMFDLNGMRTNFKLDLIEKQRGNMIKTGIWMPDVGVNYTRTSEEVEAQNVEKLQNKTLRVTTTTVSS